MSITSLKLIIMGPPASGKDTQAELLAKNFKIPIIAVGSILRKEADKNTKYGHLLKNIMQNGNLLPDATIDEIIETKVEGLKGFILDGYPRDLEQADFLNHHFKINKVLSIKISDKEAIKRISGRRVCLVCGESYHLVLKKPQKSNICNACQSKLEQRADDKPATIRQRLKIYHQMTEPLIKYYKQQKKLIIINGEQSIDQVHNEIIKKLHK